MGSPASPKFVEEINYSEIEILEVVGKGSFGVVNKGKWRDKYVAVKMISSETEKKAFIVELRQLSRVDHPNIVKLYGACQSKPVCLVMEYAEGGSLYNVLHGNLQPEYTAAHAISWALQCARGVAYLHGMKPKALIHRDLKPPNLLLIMGGTVLKICDFGTACDIQTHMTNNKGSAAWMAPEVFEGSSYSEKCDVFSWGIILWEVITRQKPFDDIRGSAYQILWAVKPLHSLDSSQYSPDEQWCRPHIMCWNKDPENRPAMDEVVNIMTHLFVFFKGAEQPIKYPAKTDVVQDEESSDEEGELWEYDSREVTCGSEFSSQVTTENTSSSDQSMNKDTYTNTRKDSTDTLEFAPASSLMPRGARISQTSAPASLANSVEDLSLDMERTLGNNTALSKNQETTKKRLTTGLSGATSTSKPSGHQRSGSYGSNIIITPAPVTNEERRRNSEDLVNNRGQAFPGNPNFPADLMPQLFVLPNWNNNAWAENATAKPPLPFVPSADTIENAYRLLEPHLQPLSPYQGSRESLQIFEEHKKMAYEYLQVRTEIALLQQRKAELANAFNGGENGMSFVQQNGNIIFNEYDSMLKEKESLQKLHENLKQQLAITRSQQQNRQ